MNICQTCKHHGNKPSRCKPAFRLYVGRKSPACADYKSDSIKVARLSKVNKEARNA